MNSIIIIVYHPYKSISSVAALGPEKLLTAFLFYSISLKTPHKNFNEVFCRYFSFQLSKLISSRFCSLSIQLF